MLFILTLLFPFLLTGTPTGATYTLTVHLTGVSQKGNLMAELRNEKNEVVKQIKQNIKTEGATITFANLPKNRYAVAVFHDENGNGKLDTNLVGIPKEAYGFSNNARGAFGPPDLKARLVELSGNRSISIKLK